MKALSMGVLGWALFGVSATTLASETAGHSGIPRSPAPQGAEVYFISPKNGAKVSSPVKVVFGLKNMGVAPAGVEKASTGHHHILINREKPETYGLPLPNDDQHRHFGGGQTETELTLPKGKHTLRLLLGDHRHIPHKPPVQSEVITITVE